MDTFEGLAQQNNGLSDLTSIMDATTTSTTTTTTTSTTAAARVYKIKGDPTIKKMKSTIRLLFRKDRSIIKVGPAIKKHLKDMVRTIT